MHNQTEQKIRMLKNVISVVGIFLVIFHLYATYTGVLYISTQKAVHLGAVLIIAVLAYSEKKYKEGKEVGPIEWLVNAAIIVVGVVSAIHLTLVGNDLGMHVADPTRFEVYLGLAVFLCLLELTRRILGNVLVGIALLAVIYAKWGNYFPAGLQHRGYSWARISSNLFLSADGMYGVPLGVSASVVVMFVIFGAFLQKSGAGEAFITTAFSLFGRVRGGPAKVAVVSSALFGSISGSSIANVVTTGTLTIPLMKKVGYKPHFAGAVEAVASTGGQIMPPIMGAAAFLIAQVLAVPYIEVVKAAVIPALLYYYAVFVVVDMQAIRDGLKGLSSSELPDIKETLKKNWFLMLPIVVLLYMLVVVKYTPNKAALYCIASCLLVSWFTKDKRMKVRETLEAMAEAARDVVTIAVACAASGVVIGMLGLTGLGLKFSSLLIEWSGGNLTLLLILIMVSAIVMGMGLPTTGVYIILSVLVAPALVEMGVQAMSAHMFVFFFGCLSAITPPVALASYAGASIAGADMNKTGWSAVRIGLAGFILPFLFIFQPSILMIGTTQEIIWVMVVATAGVTALAAGINAVPYNNWFVRLLFCIGAVLLIDVRFITDVIGFGLVAAAWLLGRYLEKKPLRDIS